MSGALAILWWPKRTLNPTHTHLESAWAPGDSPASVPAADASPDFFFWMAGFFVLGSPSTPSKGGYDRIGVGKQRQVALLEESKGSLSCHALCSPTPLLLSAALWAEVSLDSEG